MPGTVVVGAHYDTKDGIPGFVGANDGASGVAVLLELARSLPRPLAGPSVQLVAFDAEEARGDRDFDRDGTRGSRQYVEYARAGGEQGSAPLTRSGRWCSSTWSATATCRSPTSRTPTRTSTRCSRSPRRSSTATRRRSSATTFPVADDHVPFLEAGIPAVDLIDFDYGPGAPPGEYWHTPEDTLDKVCPASLETVGETALRAIPRIR